MKGLRVLCLIAGLISIQNYFGQIVINEVMVNPSTSATSSQYQSLKMCSQTTYGAEYIELYNNSSCAVDIGCYIIGFNTNFGTGTHGTFRFPSNTVIQPNGFLSIGGPNSGATINLTSQCASANLSTDGDRWYLPNGDGYLMLWDPTGTPVDAVFWTVNANESAKWGTDSDISVAPSLIAAGNTCSPIPQLPGPNMIPLNLGVSYAGQAPSMGTVIHRVTDGGLLWATNATPTINACNGVCQTGNFSFSFNATVSQPGCQLSDGSISLNPTPTDTYTFSWSYAATNTSSSASNLAQGSYLISITNSQGCSRDTTIILTEDCSGCPTATISMTPNSVCQPCTYNGPAILINEINIYPQNGDGCIFGLSPTPPGKGEWIELFNPNWCDSVDISGYILGSYNSVGNMLTTPYRSDAMGFVLPQGTKVPPLGFVVVRGANAPAPPAGTIDVVVNNNNNNLCIGGGLTSSRMWFANAGGWFAFYNAQGVPQNAIRWGSPTAGDLNQSPCIPPNNSLPAGTTTLATFNQMNTAGLASSLGTPTQGMTFRRMPDGGAWSSTLATETSSYGTCNDPSNCAVFSNVANCNGTATATITTGTPPFTYQWNDPLNQTTATATNLCDGTYQVVVTDATQCSLTYSVTVNTNPFALTANVFQPGCQQSNGSITLNPFNSSYTYTWLPNVSNTNTANNLPQGSYSITIADGSCTFDTTIVLANPNQFSIEEQFLNTTCGENNGEIILSLTPSTGNYIYQWTPNVSTTNSAFGLSPGTYVIDVTDNICNDQVSITIGPSLPLTLTATVSPTSCALNNGEIHLFASPTSNYSYAWTPNVSVADSAVAIASGTYQISITDGTCQLDTSFTVAPSIAPTGFVPSVTASNCGTANGSITISQVESGQQPYSYSFLGQNFTSSASVSNIPSGNYGVSVQDANGCAYSENVFVPEITGPTTIQFQKVDPECGTNNGTLTILNATGGVAPYTYTVNGQASQNLALTELIDGTYQIVVQDVYGCSYQENAILTMNPGNPSLFIPNVFTPNGDTANPLWTIGTNCIKDIHCLIMNRWGQVMHEFHGLDGNWNGLVNEDKAATDGVYFYKVVASYFGDRADEIFHGHITIIR